MRTEPTKAEMIFWNFLKGNYQNFRFVRQKPLEGFIVDFYCSKLKLIIEIDGSIHDRQKERDKERDNIFKLKYNIDTIRIPNEIILNNLIKVRDILDHEINSRT
jgi:very-short-patch-repair endonuclease